MSLHPAVVDHLRMILSFGKLVFGWPHNSRLLWSGFNKLKEAAGVEFPGTFHRLRFGFTDLVPADALQKLVPHRASSTTQGYVNMARRMKTQGAADQLHVPNVLKVAN